MSVYVMGDTHGGFQRFTAMNFRVIDARFVMQLERIFKIKAEVWTKLDIKQHIVPSPQEGRCFTYKESRSVSASALRGWG